jgi:CRISPR-associated Csx2 family protein
MRKILISALGAGKAGENRSYRKATYKIDDKKYDESFIGIALTKHFNIDKNIVLGTKKSIWEEYYRVFSNNDLGEYDEGIYLNLIEKIDEEKVDEDDLKELEMKLKNNHKPILIEYGIDDNELMTNFEILMGITEELRDGDELYIDITHSFRSLALYMFIILNYLQNVTDKDITISYISYGMFEGTKDDVTPVVNLNIIYEAIQWIKAASDIKKFGNTHEINRLIEVENKDLSKKLNNFTNALNMSYLSALKSQLKQLTKVRENLGELKGFSKFIVPRALDDFLDRFKGYLKEEKEHLFQLEVAKYFYDKQMYSNAYLIMHESILTYFIESDDGYKEGYSHKGTRDSFKKIIYRDKLPSEYKNDADYKDICKIYRSITIIRNTVAHGMEGRENSITDINNFIIKYNKLAKIYKTRNFYLGDYIL